VASAPHKLYCVSGEIMSKRSNIVLLVLLVSALILIKMMKYNFISTPNLPNWLAILLTFLISSGTLLWGISGLKNYRKIKPKKRKRNFFSTKFTPPEVTISYGQIFGGIIGIIAAIIWILTHGFK
jgi:hypothetical protein